MAAAKDRRLYARLDIGFDEHDKIYPLSDAAFRALVEATLYARRQLTDGFLAERLAVKRWGAEVLEELSTNDPERPSLVRVEGGWQIHDFAEHQTTNADIQAKREAGSRGGKAKAERNASKALAPASEVLEQKGSTTLAKTETETDTSNSSSDSADAEPRPEIIQLLDLLDTEIERNGGRKPNRTKKNIDATRLMLDRDGHTVDQISRAIRWCQADEFWRSNILSMSKLREKYDQLRLAAQRKQPGNVTPMKRDIPKNVEWMYR